MRLVVANAPLLAMLVACDRGVQPATQGSGLPAPQANLMKTIADGVFETPRGTTTADAATPTADAAIAAGPLTLSDDGLSTLGRIEWHTLDEQAMTALIQQRIGIPNVTVSVAVVPASNLIGGELSYWSVKRDDKEIIQVLRGLDGAPEGPRPAQVIVRTPDVPTIDGIIVGDTVATVQAKLGQLACKNYDDDPLRPSIPANVICWSFRGAHLLYIVDPGKKKLSRGDVKPSAIKNLAVIAIAHEFDN
jgi:hypothetical protein